MGIEMVLIDKKPKNYYARIIMGIYLFYIILSVSIYFIPYNEINVFWNYKIIVIMIVLLIPLWDTRTQKNKISKIIIKKDEIIFDYFTRTKLKTVKIKLCEFNIKKAPISFTRSNAIAIMQNDRILFRHHSTNMFAFDTWGLNIIEIIYKCLSELKIDNIKGKEIDFEKVKQFKNEINENL